MHSAINYSSLVPRSQGVGKVAYEQGTKVTDAVGWKEGRGPQGQAFNTKQDVRV